MESVPIDWNLKRRSERRCARRFGPGDRSPCELEFGGPSPGSIS